MSDEGTIYLRQSEFRNEDPGALEARRDELLELAADLGVHNPRVVVENDVDGTGVLRGASAHKRPERVRAGGLVTLRTKRPKYHGVMVDFQLGGGLLLVSDESRLTRDWRDGEDLLDAAEVGRGSVVALDDEGGARWVLTKGGTREERKAFRDRVNDARKFSEDLGVRVRKGRRRWAGKSYQGGRRPFGFQVEQGTEEHNRNLLHDETEAAAIKATDERLQDKRWTLAAATRYLRENGPPTVTGAPWTPGTLRDALLKPAVAGLAVRTGELVKAPWEPILTRERWEALVALLTDPARRTTTANEPRWLVSCFATCGVCTKTVKVGGAGRGRSAAYVGSECGHVRRTASKVDALVSEAVIGWLERFADTGRLRPKPPAANGHAKAMRAELAGISRDRRALMMHFKGDRDAMAAIRAKDRRAREIEAQLAALDTIQGDPLADLRAEGRAGQTVRAAWEALELPRKRAVVQLLVRSVVIERAGRTGRVFDPDSVTLTWHEEAAP
jgi:site-specific DNA recombinase